MGCLLDELRHSVCKMDKGDCITSYTYVTAPRYIFKHGIKGPYFVTIEENSKSYQNPEAGKF